MSERKSYYETLPLELELELVKQDVSERRATLDRKLRDLIELFRSEDAHYFGPRYRS